MIRLWYSFSLRWRLLSAITTLLTLLILGYGVLAYQELKADLLDTARARIIAQVSPIVIRHTPTGRLEGSSLQFMANGLVRDLQEQDLAVRYYNTRGQVLAIGDTDGQLPPASVGARRLPRGEDRRHLFIDQWGNGRQLAYYIQMHSLDGSDLGVLEVRSSLEHVEVSLQRDELILILGGLTVLGMAIAIIYLITGMALRPLAKLAITAENISKSDLSQRAPVPPGNDEVAQLVVAINSMLDQLEDALAGQRRATEQVRQFAADASHELRTPLTAVIGYVEVLKRGAVLEPREKDRVLNATMNELDRLRRLVDGLLTLARVGAGAPLNFQEINIASLLNQVAQQARILAPERRIDVQCGPLPLLVADPDKLQQILYNLVHNALIHTPLGVRITLGAEKKGENACIWVHDQGPGIPGEYLPLIFKRFWKAGNRGANSQGSGLGLPIVKAIAEAHGGSVTVDSSPELGTKFTVLLPWKH